MRVSSTIAVAALAVNSAQAAPTLGLLSSLLSGLTTTITKDLGALLSGLGIQQCTNGADHGVALDFHGYQCPFTFNQKSNPNQYYSHSITWSKGCNTANSNSFIDWTTFKANGANLGGWLEKEKTHDPIWWVEAGNGAGADAPDEWTWCQLQGKNCGPLLEARYASFLNTTTIDKLASVGVNTLRIPTTYAAWVSVPGSALYHGNQQSYLSTITKYAIEKYNMHVIIGLHSLPGGVNNLDIGEALFHDAWFNNATNLAYSFSAIDSILKFISNSGHTNAFTIAPINEASDNLAGFATPAGLSTNATSWINTYINGVLTKVAKVDKRIPVMLQDSFLGHDYWAPFYAAGTNLVIDTHVYYFAAAGIYSAYVTPAICGQASTLAGNGKFPVFIGEWALQVLYNNTFAGRKSVFDTQRYAWQKYVHGGSFWTAVSYSTAAVDGEGTQREYWSYVDLVDQGVITTATNASYC